MIKRWRELDFLKLSLAFGFALVAAGASGLAYLQRDFLFEWKRVKAAGAFSAVEDPKLRDAALAFAQEKMARAGEACVGQWVGRDERYLYLAVGCGRLEEKLGETTVNGDANFHPTRFRYEGGKIANWEQPDESEYANSMRRLFPAEAHALLRLNRDQYLKLLGAKP